MEPEVGNILYDSVKGQILVYNTIGTWETISDGPIRESYETKVKRLADKFPAVAAAKAYLDEMVALVEHE
jgi:hypothetical protein